MEGLVVMPSNYSKERRRDPRFLGNIPLKISSDNFDLVTESKNLSRSGVSCRVSQYIEPMTKLKIQLLLPFKRKDKVTTKKVSCGAVIVRTESEPANGAYNVAIFFNDIQARDAATLAEYVNNMLLQSKAGPAGGS